MTRAFIPFLTLLVASTTIIGCQQPADTPSTDSQPSAEGQSAVEMPADAPTLEELAGATFESLYDEPVTLIDGRWEGEPFEEGGASLPAVGLVQDFRLVGDLDGDGNEEAVALVWTNSGGTGIFNHIAAMGRRDGRVVNLATAELGDRVKVRSAEIAGGKIVLDTLQAGPDDAGCCPGQKMRRIWVLGDDGLTEVSTEDTGRMSLADLDGVEWVLTHFDREEAAPTEPEIVLTFEGGKIAGASGCNSYNAGITAGEMPGDISVSHIASTMMACPNEVMELERRYLAALEASEQYSFLATHLALTWSRDEAWGTMLFKARQPEG